MNLYASWRQTCGLDLHWDDHDAFILQVSGKKKWQIYSQTIKHPVAQSVPAKPSSEPVMEVVMNGGDALYVPRGWWHMVTPMNEPTVHLTVGFRNPTGLDLAARAMAKLYMDERVRADFPRFGNADAQARCLTAIQQAVAEGLGEAGLVLGYFNDAHATATPRPRFGLPWSATEAVLPPDVDDYEILPAFRFPCVVQEGPSEHLIEICFNRQRFQFHQATRVLFQKLSSVRSMPFRDFLREFEPHFSREQLTRFMADLTKCGIVTLVPGEAADINHAVKGEASSCVAS